MNRTSCSVQTPLHNTTTALFNIQVDTNRSKTTVPNIEYAKTNDDNYIDLMLENKFSFRPFISFQGLMSIKNVREVSLDPRTRILRFPFSLLQ